MLADRVMRLRAGLARLGAILVRDVGAFEGSTRAVSLIRMGVALIVLSEWGDSLILIRDLRPASVAIGASVILSSLTLFVGLFSRAAAIWAALSATAAIFFLGHELGRDFVHHHTHMLALTLGLLALTPCGGSYSVDRFLALRRAHRTARDVPERGALWGQRLLAVHVSTVYLWSAYEKRYVGFLSGARMEHLYMWHYGTSEYPEWPLFHPLMVALAWSTFALELFLAIGLWFPRTRRAAIVLGIAFHLTIYYTLPVSTFSALMILLYVAFLDPDELHRLIDWMSGQANARSDARPGS